MTAEYFAKLIAESQIEEAQRVTRVRSRIYGYTYTDDGVKIVEREAEVIRSVVGQLASIPFLPCWKILEAIAQDFRLANPQVRSRSNKLFSAASLAKLASNCTYAALELNQLGLLVRIQNYPPIISEKEYRVAWTRLKRENLA